ncbi:DUF4129 domain-containing protein [Deinococcus radiophilus]|uniref:DUF4129 domain-containing protein n=1 Tax=Deinococcus radiophilus TaxID=32062 RepID=A0A3S0ID36_9DEIO|nr:DUF4129 domain-containing protein [Deinococcus radiophilus]RTR30954.1 DUF4129 domain-containing protein [Deinococcus radiophilus]UFA49540.1 DUF4129 domain-containing protein [Deinococcus radiophilus]
MYLLPVLLLAPHPLALLAFWRYMQFHQRASKKKLAQPTGLDTDSVSPVHDHLHRVRAAYARTEAHLSAQGLTRQDAETPTEYLHRAAQQWPNLSAPLATLGAAYGPVRYGGGVSEGQADQAEQSATLILQGTPAEDPVSSDHSTIQ